MRLGAVSAPARDHETAHLLADSNSHAAAHKIEIHNRERRSVSFNFANPRHHRIVASAYLARSSEALRIRAAIDKFERIANLELREEFAPTTTVDRDRQALFDGETQMMSAF